MTRSFYIEDSLPNPIAKQFAIVRANAMANPNLYGGRYTQENIEEAYEEFKMDLVAEKENKNERKFSKNK